MALFFKIWLDIKRELGYLFFLEGMLSATKNETGFISTQGKYLKGVP